LFRDASVAPRDAAEQTSVRILSDIYDPKNRYPINRASLQNMGVVLYAEYDRQYRTGIKGGRDQDAAHRAAMYIIETHQQAPPKENRERWQIYDKAFRKLSQKGVEAPFPPR